MILRWFSFFRVLAIWKTPTSPHVGKKSQIIPYFSFGMLPLSESFKCSKAVVTVTPLWHLRALRACSTFVPFVPLKVLALQQLAVVVGVALLVTHHQLLIFQHLFPQYYFLFSFYFYFTFLFYLYIDFHFQVGSCFMLMIGLELGFDWFLFLAIIISFFLCLAIIISSFHF